MDHVAGSAKENGASALPDIRPAPWQTAAFRARRPSAALASTKLLISFSLFGRGPLRGFFFRIFVFPSSGFKPKAPQTPAVSRHTVGAVVGTRDPGSLWWQPVWRGHRPTARAAVLSVLPRPSAAAACRAVRGTGRAPQCLARLRWRGRIPRGGRRRRSSGPSRAPCRRVHSLAPARVRLLPQPPALCCVLCAVRRAPCAVRRAPCAVRRAVLASLFRAGSTRPPGARQRRPPDLFAAAAKPGGGGAVKYRPIAYDYATGSTFSVKINGKPVFLLNDFRKKVDANVKNAKYVTAFKKSLEQQVHDKKKQDAIRDQYDKAIVPRFRAVEHTDTGLTKNMLGLDADAGIDEPPAAQGEVGYSRIDQIDPWENSSGGGLEKYNPCVTSVFAPVQYQGLDDTHPQWQREPSSHLSLDFVYGYQGASCWDRSLFGEGPGMDNLHFLQSFNPKTSKMEHTGEVLYFAAATVIVFDIKNNIQRYFHHSDDVTAVTVLKRVVQRPDGSWEEAMSPPGAEAKEQWAKFFAYDKGRYIPNEQKWDPLSRLLPESSEEYPQFDDGILMDWRDWDLPNRCIVASGQRGRNPRVYVWRVVRHTGQNNLERQLLAQMTLGPKRLLVVSLSFNSKGNYLIALANDFEHHICVFDWKNKNGPQMIREGAAQSGLDSVDTCKFNPYSESAFASCGVKHLKLWEMGDDTLAEAPGLFGDLGEPIDQRTVVFNPRGNAITGTRDGDLYVWSSGTVQAKFEKAHKENVIGLLFVDGIGLFSVSGGIRVLCYWYLPE